MAPAEAAGQRVSGGGRGYVSSPALVDSSLPRRSIGGRVLFEKKKKRRQCIAPPDSQANGNNNGGQALHEVGVCQRERLCAVVRWSRGGHGHSMPPR